MPPYACISIESFFDRRANEIQLPKALLQPSHALVGPMRCLKVRRYTGILSPEEVQRFMAEYEAAWESYEFVIKDAHAVGNDRVFLHGYIRAEGRESGVALEGDLFQCFWLRHGRLFRQEDHLTRRGALRALGLDDHHRDDSLRAAEPSA